MTALVPASEIEAKVGAKRHPLHHIARAVSGEEAVYILHSQRCLDSGIDLRECSASVVLDRGIDRSWWQGYEDRPVMLGVWDGRLIPVFAVNVDGERADA